MTTENMPIEEIFLNLKKPSTKWSGYFEVYDRYFSKFRGKSPRVLEIGMLGGGSIDLWHKYFGPGAKVTGVDIDPRCATYQFDGDTEVFIGDQSNPAFWAQFITKTEPFDVIVDDGGHTMDQQSVTLQMLFPHLKNDGVMIVEDTHTSYWREWGGGYGNNNTFLHRAKQITDIMNQQHFKEENISQEILDVFDGLYSVAFFNSMVVFEKRELKPFIVQEVGGYR